jgi:hypothetical protein
MPTHKSIFSSEPTPKLAPALADAPAGPAQPDVPLQQHGTAPGMSWKGAQTHSPSSDVAKLDAEDGLVFLLPHERPRTPEPMTGPTFVKAGKGGTMLRWHDGRITGPVGGEALRLALRKQVIRKPVNQFNPQMDGKEIMVDIGAVPEWQRRGAELIGPACVPCGQEPTEGFHKPVNAHGQLV